jgi:Holliday junction resolvasome RuvABC DNA-binding subunit
MENTVAALQDAITLGREIEKDIPRLEARFQAAEAVRKAEADRIAAEKKAKYDADPAVGMKLAKHIIKQMAYEIKAKDGGHWDEITIKLATRGERKDEDLKVRYSRYGKTLFNLGWYRVSKDRALAMLADSAIDSLKVDGINIVDPKLAKFMMV